MNTVFAPTMSFDLGTTWGRHRGQQTSSWVQTTLYPPQRTYVRTCLWKTVDNQRQTLSLQGLGETTVIHNPQPLLQALDIYPLFSFNKRPPTDERPNPLRSSREVSL